MVFFQTALLAGYAYAHALQRVGSLEPRWSIHLALLVLAALFLPLHINGWLGDPEPAGADRLAAGDAGPVGGRAVRGAVGHRAPAAGLVRAGALRLSGRARTPVCSYAASNLGSFLALLPIRP